MMEEVPTIHELTVRLPREVGDVLDTLTDIGGESSDVHVQRALLQYLDGAGRRSLIEGFTERARTRLRASLDELGDL
jgi:hypothetical protein